MPDALDHIEKTLAEAYRKEIDQEENVWRTLPFFIAALTLEIAELTQIKEQLGSLPKGPFIVVLVLGAVAFLGAIFAVIYLLRSIWPADFKYAGAEPGLLKYAEELAELEESGGLKAGEAIVELKRQLAEQYAATTFNNKRINQSRVYMRSVAGALTIGSVLASLVLGAVTIGHQVMGLQVGGSNGENTKQSGLGGRAADPVGIRSEPAKSPPDPSGHQGSDGTPREHANPGGGQEGK